MSKQAIYQEIIGLADAMPVQAAAPLTHESMRLQDEDTRKLAANVMEDLTAVNAKWLAAVAPVFESLIAKAENEGVTDDDLIKAIRAAAVEFPEFFGKLNTGAVVDALTKAMGAAMVNGAIQRQRDFERAAKLQ